ncbi:ParB-like nuclease domain protein [Microbulbifer aggregans]|uniref:ParB-like nuclease domain protein n=1 Tax=Microbulbifer aggregans TaxID=1769779 RepID=A0A1C9W4R6_9GAMM|nr:ParB/RepB/Spo0J family partition protein [Microbulbifer aggregans]AOS96137.1 ParB-like nuclease domain protein [Microbulbifer aggregans]
MNNPLNAQQFIAEYDSQPQKDTSDPAPITVPISEVDALPDVFQFRCDGMTRYHIEDLAREIRRSGPLDPIEVCSYGGRYIVVDGHHRLAAYRMVKYSAEIPALLLQPDSGLELIERSLQANRKCKLNMAASERTEGAWTIARLMLKQTGALSAKRLQESTGISKGTCQNFRKGYAALESEGFDPFSFSWEEVKAHLKGHDQFDTREWHEDAARQFAEQILYKRWKASPKTLEYVRRYPDGLTQLISLIAGNQLDTAVSQLGEHGLLEEIGCFEDPDGRDF